MKTVFKLPPFPILHIAELFSKAFARYRFRAPSTAESVSHSKTPVLFIHGSADIFVPVVMSKIAYDACSSRKKLVIVEGAGHAASYYKNTALYEKTVKEFLSQ